MDHTHTDVVFNGLLPNEAASVPRPLQPEARWMKAEERTAELIALIQPNPPSQELRNAVADHVKYLITKHFYCQVFVVGSLPLNTYLPNADIDLTVLSNNEHLKDSWVNEFCTILETEEKLTRYDTKFHVTRVQYIHADVKIVKCRVEDIVVNISFNQPGGFYALYTFNLADSLIEQDHLFQRSILLIKAWCHHEGCILGARYGLISTYALHMLVLYIFRVFKKNSFVGPLEVLYRFLEFFSNFDWDKYCVSLSGPIPISALPDMTAESPRNDNKKLLYETLVDCGSLTSTFIQHAQGSRDQPFISKHFNVVDALCLNNNLGCGVSTGNLFRIRSAFAFGAKMLERLLYCPEEDLIGEVNRFFKNTWNTYGSGERLDANPYVLERLRKLNLNSVNVSGENLKNYSNSKRMNQDTDTIKDDECKAAGGLDGNVIS